MRIGILAIGSMPPNVEGFILNLARLIGDVHQIDVIVDRSPPDTVAGAARCLTYPFRSRSRGWRRLESALVLRRYAREHRPDLLTHVVDFETYGLAVTVAGLTRGIPTFVRYGGQIFEAYRLHRGVSRYRAFFLTNILGQIPLRLSTRIVTVGPNLRKEVISHGGAPFRVEVLPQPIDAGSFSVDADPERRGRLSLPIEGRVVLVVGRLERLKGMDALLQVIPRVRQIRPDTWFCFVGNGPYADRLGRLQGVTLAGKTPRRLVPEYLAAADLVLHASLTEGVANVLLEALAAGVPVVSRDVGDASFVTSHLFRTDEELVEWLTVRDWEPEALPAAFGDAALRAAYLEFIEEVVRARR